MSPYSVKTPHFEGPMPLLLDLIEKRKLHINDLALASVADDFLFYIQSAGSFSVSESADFLLVASTLVLIKSKSLLPNITLTEEEKSNITELERRLRMYAVLKEGARKLGNLAKSGDKITLPLPRPAFPVFTPGSISLSAILASIQGVLKEIPVAEKLPEKIVKKVISIEEAMNDLMDRIKLSIKISFKDFSKIGKAEKINVIVSFLAILEMVKNGAINVLQRGRFEDIDIQSDEVGTPNYI